MTISSPSGSVRRTLLPAPLSAALLLTVLLAGCDSGTDPDRVPLTGVWSGEVTGTGTGITMDLTEIGQGSVRGLADVSSPEFGTVRGTVSGTRDGRDAELAILIEGPLAAGTLAFEGRLEDDDILEGTVESGLVGGSHTVTFTRTGP